MNSLSTSADLESFVKKKLSTSFPKLSSSQRNAVHMTLEKRISLTQGLPGLGKTMTAIAILFVNHRITKTVLACGPSNVGLSRFCGFEQKTRC